MKTVIVATNNLNKLAEFRDILKSGEIHVISMKEAGVFADPEENGATIEMTQGCLWTRWTGNRACMLHGMPVIRRTASGISTNC